MKEMYQQEKERIFDRSLKFDTKTVVLMGILIAMQIILSRFMSLAAWNFKVGFGFIPVVLAAMLLGPVKGGIVGAAADFIGAILFPIGAYFPGFTLTAFLTGMIYGIFLHKKQSVINIIIAVGITEFILSLLLNSLWISMLYGAPFLALLSTRILQCFVLAPVEFLTIGMLSKLLLPRLRIEPM